MLNRILLFFLCLLFCECTLANVTYTAGEHTLAGDNVKIRFSEHDAGQKQYEFVLPSGVKATYGEILAFGDLYGNPDEPITFGADQHEKNMRFLKAFDQFALTKDAVPEVAQIVATIHDEQKAIDKAIQAGATPEQAYQQWGAETARRFNCITGGGCSADAWWLKPGRYLELAKTDYDHFGDNAWYAYQTGHQLAIMTAIVARNTGDSSKLELAYAINAFACHFLADRFATGHMRAPRIELPQKVTPAVLGPILVSYMHNEENAYGLHVHNKTGASWSAYGDHSYLSDKNQTQRQLLQTVLQLSADQIYQAYDTGSVPADGIADLLPQADEHANAANLDISPLFYYDPTKDQVLRRVDIANPYDRHWTGDWWGWSTLTLLVKTYGRIPGVNASEIATNSEYKKEAVKAKFLVS